MSTAYPGAIDSFDTHVDSVDDVMAADVNDPCDSIVAIETALGIEAWSTWTPTINQGGAVAATVTRARYKIINKICHVEVSLLITAAGVAANPIIIAGQPAAIQAAYSHASGFPIGTAIVTDTGMANYSGILCSLAATAWRIHSPQFDDWVGSGPNFALANTDVILFTATYEVA